MDNYTPNPFITQPIYDPTRPFATPNACFFNALCSLRSLSFAQLFNSPDTRSRKPYKNLVEAKSPILTDMTKKKRKKDKDKKIWIRIR